MNKIINYLQIIILSLLLIARMFLINKHIPIFCLGVIILIIFLSICISSYQIYKNATLKIDKVAPYIFHISIINLSYMLMIMYLISFALK